MRIDPRLLRNGLTPRQICFIECWGSLSHKDSLDTDRVSFNNVLNSINEIQYLYDTPGISKREKKRRFVAEELLEMLKNDPSLSDPVFNNIPERIRDLLDYKAAWSDTGRSPIEKDRGLMESYFTELRQLLLLHYIPVNTRLLDAEVNKAVAPTQADYGAIISICNNIMSFMLTLGIPLMECNFLYSRVLLDRALSFSDRFTSWKAKVSIREQSYKVTFSMENNKLYDMLTSTGNQITFNECLYKNFINGSNKKITHVEIEAKSFSVLAAKRQAQTILKDSLDVVAYMLGSGNIDKHQSFTVIDEAGESTTINEFSDEILTNTDRLTLDAFTHFMGAMTTLYEKSTPASARKVSAAFRFLRNGLEIKDSEENRFSAYWSALESLTQGVCAEKMDHDDHVVHTTPACMGFDYIIKQLIAIRGMSRTLNVRVSLQDGTLVHPGSSTLHQVYLYLKDAVFLTNIQSGLQNYPYALFTVLKFAALCNDAQTMGGKILSHSRKVERHLYRLYILRNAIAHNAESNPHIVFLTANLEHYLRGTITAMFYTSHMIDVVDSPESAFQRYLDMYEVTLNQLEPTYGRDEKEHASLRGKIIRGDITPKDEKLQSWIRLHN